MNGRTATTAIAPDSDFVASLTRLATELRVRARFLTQDAPNADDLAQDVIERALAWRNRMRTGTNLRAWTNQVLRNLFITEYRHRATTARVLANAPPTPERDAGQPEVVDLLSMADIESALSTLTAEDAEIFRLAYVEGRPHREIAERFALVRGTVATRLHRARRKLKRVLTPVYNIRVRSTRSGIPA